MKTCLAAALVSASLAACGGGSGGKYAYPKGGDPNYPDGGGGSATAVKCGFAA